MSPVRRPLAERLEEFQALEAQGLSMAQMAARMGVSARSVRQYATTLLKAAGEKNARYVAGKLREPVLDFLAAHRSLWFSAGEIARGAGHTSGFLSTKRGVLPALVADGLIEERVSARVPVRDERQVCRYRITAEGVEREPLPPVPALGSRWHGVHGATQERPADGRSIRDWHREGACRGSDSRLWFPTQGDHGAAGRAKRICGGCQVRQLCLAHALKTPEEFGIWGGMSPRERNRHKRKLQAGETA